MGGGAAGMDDEQACVVGRLLVLRQQSRHDRVAQLLRTADIDGLAAGELGRGPGRDLP
ncbi:hypothetical protein SUDANB1_00133 [Streptomyces sp. enrichment culture]